MKEHISRLIEDYGFEIGNKSEITNEEFELSLRRVFEKYFDKEYITNNFSIPSHLKDFTETFEGGLWQEDWRALYTKEGIISATEDYCETWSSDVMERRKLNQSQPNDKMWLCVGYWSDKHDYVICCDKSSKHFGKFYDVLDNHPWIGYGDLWQEEEYDSILDFLMVEFLKRSKLNEDLSID